MTHKELDDLWTISVNISIAAGDSLARYRFAESVATLEREACAKVCDEFPDVGYVDKKLIADYHAYLIRQRGQA
jgi:hypothetical protein